MSADFRREPFRACWRPDVISMRRRAGKTLARPWLRREETGRRVFLEFNNRRQIGLGGVRWRRAKWVR
jgi:hypothetical protein